MRGLAREAAVSCAVAVNVFTAPREFVRRARRSIEAGAAPIAQLSLYVPVATVVVQSNIFVEFAGNPLLSSTIAVRLVAEIIPASIAPCI